MHSIFQLKQDIQMYNFLKHYNLDGIVVATKADKVSRNEMQKSLSLIRKTLEMKKEDKIFPVSALDKTGQENLLNEIGSVLEEECNS